MAKGFTKSMEKIVMRRLLQTKNFSPIRVSISTAANLGWSQYPVDVKNAFLGGTLKEKLYMSPSPEFVCKLHQSMLS